MAKKPKKKKNSLADGQIIKTQIEAAKYADVDERTIRRWKEAGMPMTSEGWYIKSVLVFFKSQNIGDVSDDRQRRLKAEADERELKVKKLEKELQDTEAVLDERLKDAIIARIYEMKRVMMAGPRSIAPQLVGKSVNKIIELLSIEYRHYMKVFAGEEEK